MTGFSGRKKATKLGVKKFYGSADELAHNDLLRGIAFTYSIMPGGQG